MLLDLFSRPTLPVVVAQPVIPVRKGEVLLVDGLNVMNARKDVEPKLDLRLLLVLLIEVRRAGGEFCCIFDANTPYLLERDAGKKICTVYQELRRKYSNLFAQSTGGLRADDVLLQRANSLPSRRIVSNDRFRTFWEKYPWLKKEDEHLVKFVVVGDKLQVPGLGLICEWERHMGDLGAELISLLPGV
jgi:hypothetical protein